MGAFLKQTDIERVTNDDNLFWNSPLPVFCSSARNGPAVVSNTLPESHFKDTSYCELVKGRLEGRPNISDIKYFHPPQTENYITLSPFTTSSISTHFISYESLLE